MGLKHPLRAALGVLCIFSQLSDQGGPWLPLALRGDAKICKCPLLL